MSLTAVQAIIGKAIIDPGFREQLKTDPDAIFAIRDVTPDEIAAIRAMDWDAVSSIGTGLEQRVSRMGIMRADPCK